MCGSEGTILTSELWVGQGTRVRVKRGDKKRQSARFENLRNPPPKQKMSHGIPSESGGQALRTKQMLVILATLLAWLGLAHSFMMGLANGPPRAMINRREAVIAGSTIFASGVLMGRPYRASAATKINKPLGKEAFRKIRDARQFMDRVDVPLRSRRFDEVTDLLEKGPTADLETSLVDLVKSNVLPSEDKVAVGTIRRYGLAADVLISMGGLSAAARDGDGGEAFKMLTLAKESLNDILTIGVNNDLNKTE